MEALMLYQIKSACCLGLFCLGYLLLIRNLTFYRLNRFYLLSAMVLSVVIPFIRISIPVAEQSGVFSVVLDTVTVNASPEGRDSSSIRFGTTWIKIIYLAVSMGFAGFFIHQLIGLAMIIHRHGITRKGNLFWVSLPANLSSFSFFHVLFVNTSLPSDGNGNAIIQHEMAHARQLHSFDILWLECMKIMQWYNPFLYITQRFLKETHEYLADEAVLEQNSDSAGYRLLLLSQVFGIQPGISNCFNHSLIKKRFAMMTKEKSPLIRQVRYLLVLPVAAVLIFIFSCRLANAQVRQETAPDQPAHSGSHAKTTPVEVEATDEVFIIVEEMPEFQGGGVENMMTFIQQNVTYPEAAKKSHVQGKVFVEFIIDEKGNVTKPRVIRSTPANADKKAVVVVSHKEDEPESKENVFKELEDEAIRVVSSMPAWKPGKQRGKQVKVKYVVPVNFLLQ